MTKDEIRAAIVAEAKSWLGTPYLSNGLVKGVRGGGTDCAMLLVGVYNSLGLIPGYVDPRPYPPEWHVHRTEELYMSYVLRHSVEIPGPPRPGDVVMFKIGNVHAHGAIVIDWPNVIHAIGNGAVMMENVLQNKMGKRALAYVPRKFFSLECLVDG